MVSSLECYLPLADLVDLDKERARLAAEHAQLGQEIARSEKLLANPGFVSKAPAEVVQKERSKVEEYRERKARVQARLDSLS
jgi:valyl-tRNA synthetase